MIINSVAIPMATIYIQVLWKEIFYISISKLTKL